MMDTARTGSGGRSFIQTQDVQGTNDLITNLDHELPDVRLRALKCLLRKLDNSIVSTESLSQRVDLLNRLAEWLRTESCNAEELQNHNIQSPFDTSASAIPLAIELIHRLSQHESFRRLVVREKVDSLLTQLRLQFGGELRSLIDRVLDLVSVGSFDVHFHESPPKWDDNASTQSAQHVKAPSQFSKVHSSKDVRDYSSSCEYFSPTSLKVSDMDHFEISKDLTNWTKNCHYGIYKTALSSTDRRLLSSTIESLLSKNEPLVFMTISFVRDILLNDFPAEIFIQEASLSMSMLEIACTQWEDTRIEGVAMKALLKLSALLRQRFALMNSSEFYQFQPVKNTSSTGFHKGMEVSSRLSIQTIDNGDTDYFITNLIQILKGFSRSLLFNCEGARLWILMESYAFTLFKCSSSFPVDSKSLAMSLQDVLLDLAHCYDKNHEIINTPALALVMSSVLNSLHVNDEVFIVANEVRRVIKRISCCPRLFHHWSVVYQHYLQYVSPFDSSLDPVTKHMELVCKGLEEICNVLDLSKEVDMTEETFSFAKESIPYLSYIESENSLNNFIERTFALCTNPMFSNLLPSSEERLPVILLLMAHQNECVRSKIYCMLRNLVKKYFGPGRSPTMSNEEKIALHVILNKEFFKEVLHFGLKDSVSEVQHYSEEIVLFLMKCKQAVGRELWEKVFSRLNSNTIILEAHADPQTVLGKSVLNFCNPMSNDNGLSGYELLCSNLRFLYSCNSRVREEASDRLMKILNATETGSVTFRYASYSNYTLSSIFNVGRNLDVGEVSSSGTKDAPFQAGIMLRQLEICREEDLESNVRKNALSHVASLLEDFRYHEQFLQENAVQYVVEMIAKIATEKDYKYSMDMWPPAVRTLKLISIRSARCRKLLLEDKELLVNLSCGLFALRADDRFRLEAVHLMSLILFHPFIRLGEGDKCFLPEVLITRCRIPIAAEPYLSTSSHATPAGVTPNTDEVKNKSFDKFPMENIFKSWWTFGRTQNKNTKDDSTLMKSVENFKRNRNNKNIIGSQMPKDVVAILLTAIQNATHHQGVVVTIEQIWQYLLPLVMNTRSSSDFLDYICRDSPWRDTFYRFLSVEPTCSEDEELLIKVLELCTFLLSNVYESGLITSWIVPLCLEKKCACLRSLVENACKKDSSYSGTMVPTILRSLFDFYNVLLTKHESVVAENILELFSALCQILHSVAEDGFSSSALLHPVLHNLAILLTYQAVVECLSKNNQLASMLLYEVTEAIISIQERSGARDSFRNRGLLYYSSLTLLHLVRIISKTGNESSWDGIGKSISVIPFLWVCDDARIRAAGFQISHILTSSSSGTSMLFSCLESPVSVWVAAYSSVMDLEEVPVVKHKAANVLLNLIISWDGVSDSSLVNQSMKFPKWSVVEDITNVLSSICWCSHMSTMFRKPKDPNESSRHDDSSDASHMITPKVLSVLGRLIVAINKSNLQAFHSESFSQNVSICGLCPLLFRIAGSHQLTGTTDVSWWLDCCFALSCVVEAIISLSQTDRSIAVTLIGDKRNLNNVLQFLVAEPPLGSHKEKCFEVLSSLWINIFTLLSILCIDSGKVFEDLERNIWIQKTTIFSRLVDWLKDGALAKCRKVALNFTCGFLSILISKPQEKETTQQMGYHPVLCAEWEEKKMSYGTALCQSLLNALENSINSEEKLLVLNALATLLSLSATAKNLAIEANLVEVLVGRLQQFGVKYIDAGDAQSGKKNYMNWYEETVAVLTVLSVLLYGSLEAKEAALRCSMADTIHKILKWWKFSPDRSLLYLFIETLLNFTEEFQLGSQSLTLTTNMVGVGPKKVATPQSLLSDLLNVLQLELDALEKNPSLKTIEIMFSLLKNLTFVLECRTVLSKGGVPHFLKKLHLQEMKKWNSKQHSVKNQFLSFLVHLTVYPDMQTFFAKMSESTEILILLIESEQPPTSSMTLKILRNLTFNTANRARFLCDNGLMPALSTKLRTSENLEEIESSAVGLWALIANSEKGKLLAKKASCQDSLVKAVTRVRKMEQCSNDLSSEKRDLSSLLTLLGNVSNLLSGTSGPLNGSVSNINNS